jgi:hypothetical protein
VDAETYLRNLAESELRRYRDGGPETMPEATGRMRAVAAAFAGTGALGPAVAGTVLDELTTALTIRSPRDPRARHRARLRHAPSAAAVDILVISRTADMRASAPLSWWTS